MHAQAERDDCNEAAEALPLQRAATPISKPHDRPVLTDIPKLTLTDFVSYVLTESIKTQALVALETNAVAWGSGATGRVPCRDSGPSSVTCKLPEWRLPFLLTHVRVPE